MMPSQVDCFKLLKTSAGALFIYRKYGERTKKHSSRLRRVKLATSRMNHRVTYYENRSALVRRSVRQTELSATIRTSIRVYTQLSRGNGDPIIEMDLYYTPYCVRLEHSLIYYIISISTETSLSVCSGGALQGVLVSSPAYERAGFIKATLLLRTRPANWITATRDQVVLYTQICGSVR